MPPPEMMPDFSRYLRYAAAEVPRCRAIFRHEPS